MLEFFSGPIGKLISIGLLVLALGGAGLYIFNNIKHLGANEVIVKTQDTTIKTLDKVRKDKAAADEKAHADAPDSVIDGTR